MAMKRRRVVPTDACAVPDVVPVVSNAVPAAISGLSYAMLIVFLLGACVR